MKIDLDRKLLAEMAILMTICVGAWAMVVRPKTDELAALHATIESAQADPLRKRHASIELYASRIDSVRARVHEISRLNEISRDASRMYGLIMDLAKAHRVNVQTLDPGSNRRGDDGASRIDVARFNMRIDGRYEDVAEFLDGIARIEGFVRPGSLTLTPRRGASAIVDAQFSCETLGFNLPDSLVAMVEAGDAHE